MNSEIDPYDQAHFVRTYRDRLHSDVLPRYQSLMRDTLDGVLRRITIEHGIPISDVSSRIKHVSSVGYKLKRKSYLRPLEEMQDLLGLRVVTAFSMDVGTVAARLRDYFVASGFEVENYDDKAMGLGIDRFGYRSWHMNVRPTNETMRVAPWNNIEIPLWCELQIRTLLQWGWADASHQLVYKGAAPKAIHRRINAVSAILEMSEDTLSNTRKEIGSYKNLVQTRLQNNDLSDEADIYSVGVFLKHLESVDNSDMRRRLWTIDEWFECATRAGMIPQEDRYDNQDHRYDAISASRLMLLLSVIRVNTLSEVADVLRLVQPAAESLLRQFVSDVVAHGGYFNADAIDAMNIAISMQSNRDGWRWGNLPENFDWSGDVADQPTPVILSSLRRVALGANSESLPDIIPR
jgi:ppGpp synthetase/RelA/SpoT-type nucleotidyltranferase